MTTNIAPIIRIAVVDPAPQDYNSLLAAAGVPGVSLHFLYGGRDALRFARRYPAGLWVINSELPDMGGFELAEMLRSMRPSALVFMIGDEYRLDDEIQAMTLGLAKYLCKPLEPSWILPNSHDFCIPMPAYRSLPAVLQVVQASEGGADLGSADGESIAEEQAETILLSGAREEDENEVILPFNPNFRQKPAA